MSFPAFLHHTLITDHTFLEPAKAGRHLEKALEDLRIKRNSSSTSLNTATVSNSNPPVVNTETPQERIASLQTENEFLRNLVEQSSKEKTVLVSTIEGLQKENSSRWIDETE